MAGAGRPPSLRGRPALPGFLFEDNPLDCEQSYGTTKYGTRLGPTANFNTYATAFQTIMQLVLSLSLFLSLSLDFLKCFSRN